MKNTKVKLLAIVPLLVLFFFGCATTPMKMMPTAFNPQTFEEGRYAAKVDNFIVIFDASYSMSECHPNSPDGFQKLDIARTVISRMNKTIPGIKLGGALRTFGHSPEVSKKDTDLLYGLAPYSKGGLQSGLDKVKEAGGNTPMSVAITAATEDLSKASGKIAAILISDGKDLGNAPLKAAEAMKAKYGDRLCIYTILVGDDPKGEKLLIQIAKVGGCGFATNADDILSADGMANFVEKVFLAAKPAPKPEPKPAPPAPKDSDGDGVYDSMDKCPGTPTGARVNKDGCWVLGDALFDTDKSVIKIEAFGLLEEVFQVLKKNPKLKVELAGHTDSRGTVAYNQKLSMRRAEAVKAYLVNKGIDAKRISTVGYGLAIPAATNKTASGRALNRRVVITPR